MKAIQCWQCGTGMTLDALASNDGDCPECEVEIYLGEYLSEALDTNQRLREALADLLESPASVVQATVPRAGIEMAPPYQVVLDVSVSLTRWRKAQAALSTANGEVEHLNRSKT